MAKVLAYEFELNGVRQEITNLDQLNEALKESQRILKSQTFGTPAYGESLKQVAALKNAQAQMSQQVRDTGRQIEISADKGKKSYRALNAELVNARRLFKELSEEERNSKIGQNLLKDIQRLDTELKSIDASMGQYQRNVGNYTSAFSSLGGIDIAELATVPGAIVAIGTAVIGGAQEVFRFSEEFRKLRGELQTLTDDVPAQIDQYASQVSAIVDTFQVEQTEVIQAANAASKQLGIDFGEALRFIGEGFVAGSNANGEFLQSIREYPAFFKEAGLSAEDFFSVLNAGAEQGIYSDKAVDAVKESLLRLRELPKATQDALNAIGFQTTEIRDLIDREGVGAAIAAVSKRLGELKADSPQVGQALADIFGGPGEDAGLDFIVSLQNIGKEQQSLIDKTNEYQVGLQNTLRVNEEFAAIQNEISRELSGTTGQLGNVGTQIKTVFLELLLGVIRNVKSFWESLTPVRNALQRIYEALGLVNENGERTERALKILNVILDANKIAWNFVAGAIGFVIDRVADFIGGITAALEWLGILDKDAKKTAEAAKAQVKAQKDARQETQKTGDEVERLTKKTEELSKKTKEAAVVADQFAKGSIAQLRKEVSDLNKELEQADPAQIGKITERLIKAEQQLEKVEALRNKLRRDLVGPVPGTVAPIESGARPGAGGSLDAVRSQLDEELNLRTEFEKTVTEMRGRALQERLEQEQLAAEQRAAVLQETEALLFQGTQQVIESLTGLSQARTQNEIAVLEERYGREIELAAGNEAKQEELRAKLSTEVAKIEKREFERQKRYRIAAAFTSLAEGIVNTLSAPSTIPDPFGTIFKALRVGILIATTAAQVANIQSQQAARGLLVRAANGRIVDGRIQGETHLGPSGGVALSLNGLPVLAEHGEAVDVDEFGGMAVINKRSTAAFSRTLHNIRGKVFPGKRTILSNINTAMGGIPFAATGAMVGPSSASVTKTYTATQVVTRLSKDDIQAMAIVVGQYVQQGSKSGVADGVERGTVATFRERRLQSRTGV